MAKKEFPDDASGEVSDSASADAPQPQLVKHRPMMAEPGAVASEDPATAPLVNRGAKKIAPVSDPAKDTSAKASPFDTIPTDDEKVAASEQKAEATPEADSPKPEKAAEDAKNTEVDDTVAEQSDGTDDDTEQAQSHTSGSVESETSSADSVREAELDKLITARTYAAPISTRKSSRAIVGSLSVVALVLLLVLGDVWLDMGLLNISGVPHTHFFSAKSGSATSTSAVAPTVKPKAKDSAKATLARSSVAALAAGIDQYAVTNKGAYPAELTVANLSTVDPTVLSPPVGVAYSYKVLPAGCTTAAHNCKSYTLTATDTTTHVVLASEHS